MHIFLLTERERERERESESERERREWLRLANRGKVEGGRERLGERV